MGIVKDFFSFRISEDENRLIAAPTYCRRSKRTPGLTEGYLCDINRNGYSVTHFWACAACDGVGIVAYILLAYYGGW